MRVRVGCLALLACAAFPAKSEPTVVEAVNQVMQAASEAFAEMPQLRVAPATFGFCGADPSVNEFAVYCTSQNVILVTGDALARPDISYLVAHLLGHAVQVRHGVADVALGAIRRRPSEEAVLRSFVAAQVDCLAGYFHARAGLTLDEDEVLPWFEAEPFTGIHWGRDPLRIGPEVSVGKEVRAGNFMVGWSQNDLEICDFIMAELAPGLLAKAVRDE